MPDKLTTNILIDGQQVPLLLTEKFVANICLIGRPDKWPTIALLVAKMPYW